MNATKIEYLNFTWSPLVGCSGDNCAVYKHCFAKKFKKRNLLKCPKCYEFIPHRHFERLEQPFNTKMPRLIGVCFAADFWDKGFDMADRMPVLTSASVASQHWFINLTKQPQNIPDMPFPTKWVQGVTVNRKSELWRIDELQRSYALTKMISFEPVYEDLGIIDLTGIDWVIIGNQTHPTFEASWFWIDSLVKQAKAKGIPVFIKNNIKDYVNLKEYPAKFASNHKQETEEVEK
jgi:protein gp37